MTDRALPRRINLSLPRGFDWPAALLLLAAMLTAASRLVATKWTDDLTVIQTVSMLGVIAGLALGASRFSGRLSFYFAAAYGLFVVPWQLGSVQQTEALWHDRLATIGYRLGVIIYQLINKLTILDSLLFLTLMCGLFWGLSVYAGFAIVRHRDPWKVIVPTGLALFVIQYYDPAVARRAWYLAFFIFFGLVMVARLAFVREHNRWQDTRTSLPPHLSIDFIRFGVLFASALVLLAWTAPALARSVPAAERLWEPVRSRWNEAVSDFNYAFASLRSTRQVFSPVYGNNASLGRGAPLGNATMFNVRAPASVPAGTRFYWRARTYDIYQGGQWYASVDLNRDYDPTTANLVTPSGIGRWEGIFEFVSGVQMGTIFTPSQPVWVSHPGRFQYMDNPDGTLDISAFVADPTIRPGQIYEVRSSISAPTISQMRLAGQDYPSWITERYLQLPAEITPRTRRLAEEITAGLDNPYDKAAAITAWLRNNMTYVEVITGNPAPGQESVDWFLFDLKQGFCNYYATAEIVLLRSLGIPARWSIGYAQGQLVEENQDVPSLAVEELNFIVRNRDAHSWPEVYFPGIGWVEFEPTVAQPDIQRLSDNPVTPLQDTSPFSPGLEEEGKDNPNAAEGGLDAAAAAANAASQRRLFGAVVVAVLLCIAIAVGLRFLPVFGYPPAAVLFERLLQRIGIQPPEIVRRLAQKAAKAPPPKRVIRLAPLPVLIEQALLRLGTRPPGWIARRARYARLPALARAYDEINRGLARLGSRPAATTTPNERAGMLSGLVPAAADPAAALVQEYQLETFSPRPANLPLAQESARLIRGHTLRAYFRRLLRRFQRSELEERRRRALTVRSKPPAARPPAET